MHQLALMQVQPAKICVFAGICFAVHSRRMRLGRVAAIGHLLDFGFRRRSGDEPAAGSVETANIRISDTDGGRYVCH